METNLLPVRMIVQFSICKRLFHLQYVEKYWESNEHTAKGDHVHSKLERKEHVFLGAGKKEVRGIELSSDNLGITGKLDKAVILDGKFKVVEYKKGKKPDKCKRGVWPSDLLQATLYYLLLLENNIPTVDEIQIYYAATKDLVNIKIQKNDIEYAKEIVQKCIKATQNKKNPDTLDNTKFCVNGCSLKNICMPGEAKALKEGRIIKDLRVSNKPGEVVYVQDQGASICLIGSTITIEKDGECLYEARLNRVQHVCTYGNINISTPTRRELHKRGITIFQHSYQGNLEGIYRSKYLPNLNLRIAQIKKLDDENFKLSFAKKVVMAKVKNTLKFFTKQNQEYLKSEVKKRQHIIPRVESCDNIQTLLGLEGEAAKITFELINNSINFSKVHKGFTFEKRSKRPPKDPINAMLSFSYSLLRKEVESALLTEGLDSQIGFFHTLHPGKNSLRFDLMEEFRAPIALTTVIRCLNKSQNKINHFIEKENGGYLNEEGRGIMIQQFHQRLEQTITHPIMEVEYSFRRIFEIQARLLSRYILGDLDSYHPFLWR